MANTLIRIVRKWQTAQSTISEYSVDGGDLKGFILERPGPDSSTPNLRLRIPEGTYQMRWHDSSLSGVAPYNPVPHLFNAVVPQSRYILMHNGNYPENTDGCLLVGKTRGTDFVSNSVAALNALKDFLNGVDIDQVNVIVSSMYSN
ncbi:hypothetical protein J5J83_01545 [Azoarcus sp. L1K30]|uniref:DUF5675 family protein n=1 Tax=Azoarcus sp. L1K30 TaxID=2820277 RepID=UPI001B81C7B3|nr:DUF5675 family protein [Azoarcus sp. L1K30]MBR0564798.1 hypothetical protein [Azoarcus sp. L1K30]